MNTNYKRRHEPAMLVKLILFLFILSIVSSCGEYDNTEFFYKDKSSSPDFVAVEIFFNTKTENNLQLTDYTKPNLIVASISSCSTGYEKNNIMINIENDTSSVVYVPSNDMNCLFIINSITLADGEIFIVEEEYLNNSSSYWVTGSTATYNSSSGGELELTVLEGFETSTAITTQVSLQYAYNIKETGGYFKQTQ